MENKKIIWNGYYHIIKKNYHRSRQNYAKVADLVLEKKLGRPLLSNEVSHHIDENKLNDSPENLAVMTISEHSSYHAKKRGSGFKPGHKAYHPNYSSKKTCVDCGIEFIAKQPFQIRCGSKSLKTGCSWKNILLKKSAYSKSDKMKEYQRKYQNIWKKKQRLLNTPYAQRQRELMKKRKKEAISIF